MALMAVDHTSVSFGAYSHGTGVVSEGASAVISQWNGWIPYTLRSATHLCAGGFAMLMGMGIAYFVASRKRTAEQARAPSWTAQKQLRHFGLRTVAMFLVNFFGWQLIVALSGVWLWVFNIVLIALAVDYFFVGALYVFIAYHVEPALARFATRLMGTSSCRDEDDQAVEIAPQGSITTAVGASIDVFLLVLAAISLWAGIWTAPNHGACLIADKLSKGAHMDQSQAYTSQQQLLLLGHIVAPQPYDYCKSAGSAFFGFLFQQVACLDKGILSSFPPVGWLPFVLLGVVYGRTLLRLSSPSKVSALNASLSILFALLFVSTRLLEYGNLSTNCLDTIDQDTRHHHNHASGNQYLASFRSFFYIVKYPPSPAFAFATMSGNFLLLYIFNVLSYSGRKVDSLLRSRNNPLLVFGNNPLFFYGTHGWYITLLSKAYLHTNLPGSDPATPPSPPGWGIKPQIGLGGIFVTILASVLIVMFFACRAYGDWKKTKGRESVWRFL